MHLYLTAPWMGMRIMPPLCAEFHHPPHIAPLPLTVQTHAIRLTAVFKLPASAIVIDHSLFRSFTDELHRFLLLSGKTTGCFCHWESYVFCFAFFVVTVCPSVVLTPGTGIYFICTLFNEWVEMFYVIPLPHSVFMRKYT